MPLIFFFIVNLLLPLYSSSVVEEDNRSHLSHLPKDIKNEIISYLNGHELRLLSQVNKEFHSLIDNDSFWTQAIKISAVRKLDILKQLDCKKYYSSIYAFEHSLNIQDDSFWLDIVKHRHLSNIKLFNINKYLNFYKNRQSRIDSLVAGLLSGLSPFGICYLTQAYCFTEFKPIIPLVCYHSFIIVGSLFFVIIPSIIIDYYVENQKQINEDKYINLMRKNFLFNKIICDSKDQDKLTLAEKKAGYQFYLDTLNHDFPVRINCKL